MPAEPAKFAGLFKNPTVEQMYALSARDFERFVAYVLRRAGYEVKEVGPHFIHGVDLEMRVPGKARIVGGVECKRFGPDNLVKASVVMGVKGAPAVSHPGAKPFVITTSDFTDAAHDMAEAGAKQANLLNGAQLVRYIKYIQGSLRDDDDTITVLSPDFFAGWEATPTSADSDTIILTVANNKGGVGKTTTAYYLGAEIASQGDRVLLIDLDGQANLTEWCFPEQASDLSDESEHLPNIAEYFAHQKPLKDLVKETDRPNLAIIPADTSLALRDLGGSGRPGIEFQFARDVHKLSAQSLAALGGKPDWIIIDTPPALSNFTRAGLAAAHYVLAPVRPRRRSIKGTVNILNTLVTMNALTGNHASFIGVAVTHWDGLQISKEVVNVRFPLELVKYDASIFETMIPIDNQLETLQPGAKTPGAKAYATLAEEVTRHVHTRGQLISGTTS